MSSLQGYITATYDELVNAFGDPEFGPDEESGDAKVTCEWTLQIGGHECRIYDWKEYTGVTPRREYRWHVGGDTRRAEQLVLSAFKTGITKYNEFTDAELVRFYEAILAASDAAEELDNSDLFESNYAQALTIENELRQRGHPDFPG